MADYAGSDRRLAYLFANGGGGGGSCKVISGYYHDGSFYEDQSYTQIITGSEDSLYIDLDTTTLYLFDGTDYVEVQGGGGGAVDDGTVGVRVDVTIPASGSQTYTYAELGITKKGYYLIGCCSSHAETNGGWKYLGYLSYSGQYVSNYQSSYIKAIDSYYTNVTLNESAKTVTFYNTSSGWGMNYRIEILPLHPKIEVEKHTYSTTEQVVGTWVDGKPIYELTTLLPITYAPQTGGAQNAGNQVISVANVGLITDLKVLPLSPSTASHIQTCRTSAFQVSVTDVYAYSDRIQLNQMTFAANLAWVGVSGVYVIVQYTKTTD